MKQISQVLEVPESLIYVMGMEKDDVPENKQVLYNKLIPVIKGMVMHFATQDEV
jgi:hypothetical protein